MRELLLVVALWLGISHPAFALDKTPPLRPSDVLTSALTHYPAIAQRVENQRYADGRLLESQGSFDLTFEQSLYARTSGYYDGRQSDSRLVKPLPYMNSRVYGGYRVSDGDFPVYEDKLITNSGGEYLFGVQLSLLRDRLVDSRRLAVANNRIDQEIAAIELELTRIGVQHDALYHYWQWLAAGHTREVYADLLRLSRLRQQNLEQQVERGDVAAILLTENRQNLVKREAQLNDAERDLQVKAAALSLYLRDAQGHPRIVEAPALPVEWPKHQLNLDSKEAFDNLAKRPELAMVAQDIEQAQNTRLSGENALLPKADVNLEFSNDEGSGTYARDPAETLVKLNVSIPLQRRIGQGRVQQAEAKLRQLELEKILTQDRLRIEMQNAFTNLHNSARFVELTAQELDLAQQMQTAEKHRFQEGGSDFFLLNLREEKAAEAHIRHIEAQKTYMISLTHLKALAMDFSAFHAGGNHAPKKASAS
jgi:outer membrane protein TolC